MPDLSSNPPRKIDPQNWSEILDGTSRQGSRFIFRRTSELAFEICALKMLPEQRWLDIGCGTGHLAHRLSLAGADVVGVDRDLGMLEFARQRWSRSPLRQKLQWVLSSAERLPFGDCTIDGAVATSLTGYLPAMRPLFQEARRVLRPHGYVVISFTNRASLLLKLNYSAACWVTARSSLRPDRAYVFPVVGFR